MFNTVKKPSIIRSGMVVVILICLGKLISFVRDLLISSHFGATSSSDAYFAANNIPSILYTAIISSAVLFFIPLYNERLVNEGKIQADFFTSNVLTVFTSISLVLSIIGVIFAPQLIFLVAPGFSDSTYLHATQLTRILCLSFPFSCITLLLSSVSNANQRYVGPQLIPIISASCVIIGILLFSEAIGIYAVALSSVLAFVLQAFLQKLFVRDLYSYKWVFKPTHKDLKVMAILILPVFIGTSVDQINLFVDSVLSSKLPLGSLSSLNYGQRLQATINGTFSTAMVTVLYPIISLAAAKKEYNKIEDAIVKGIRALSLVLIPITIIIIFDGVTLVKLIYFRGAFGSTALEQTSSVFIFYSISLVFLAYKEMYTRVFYVYSDSKTPVVIGVATVILHLLLSLLFVGFLGVGGLALATSISTILSSTALRFYLKKKWNFNIEVKGQIKFFLSMFFACCIMIMCRFGVLTIFNGKDSWVFIFTYCVLGLISYLIALFFMKVNEIHALKAKIQGLVTRSG